ncbi:MAG: D-alanine--D-alanine ligase [Bdellovibrionota bacterium]
MKITKNTRVGVLLGGLSSEREVSIRSGTAILKALKSKGYRAVPIDARRDLPRHLIAKKVQVAFNALHGKWGEDGCVQGLLEVMGIPYTGSGVVASALCMDKSASKKIFAAAGLSTPSFIEVSIPEKGAQSFIAKMRSPFPYPVVVKPAHEGSSVGVGLVERPADFRAAVKAAAKWGRKILVEKYVKGPEVAVAVLGGKALGTVEIRTRRKFYDYKAKYTKGETQYLVPAPIDRIVGRRVMDAAVRAQEVTGCEGLSRVDFILDDGIEPNVLEVNTLPGMTELSLVPQIARAGGMSFEDLCEHILLGARLKLGEAK